MHLEYERRKHRTEFVDGHGVVTLHEHVAAPLADADHKKVDLEIVRPFPLAKYVENSLLRVLVFEANLAGVQTN